MTNSKQSDNCELNMQMTAQYKGPCDWIFYHVCIILLIWKYIIAMLKLEALASALAELSFNFNFTRPPHPG